MGTREDYKWWYNYKYTEEGEIHDQYLLNLNKKFRDENQEMPENTQTAQIETTAEEEIQVTIENNQENTYNQNFPELGYKRVKRWDPDYQEWDNTQNISFLDESRLSEASHQENPQ